MDYNLPARKRRCHWSRDGSRGHNCLRGRWRLRGDIGGCWMRGWNGGRRSLHQRKRMMTHHEDIRSKSSPLAFKRLSSATPKPQTRYQKRMPNPNANLYSKYHCASLVTASPYIDLYHIPRPESHQLNLVTAKLAPHPQWTRSFPPPPPPPVSNGNIALADLDIP